MNKKSHTMKSFIKQIVICLICVMCFACNNNAKLEMLGKIKAEGNNNPERALNMLDSVCSELDNEDEYVRMKCMLLSMRLKDKAYMLPRTDDSARTVVRYFEEYGNELDKQEAYYYAGSVYRDLHDTPRALEHFQKALEIGTSIQDCDSTLLRNTYSNIQYLFFIVQDYPNALKMALKEYEISEKIGKLNYDNVSHVVECYLRLDSMAKTERYLEELFASHEQYSSRELYGLLYYYSYIRNREKADYIYNFIKKKGGKRESMDNLLLAEYFSLLGNKDSAIACYKRIIEDDTDIVNSYDATRFLFNIYKQKGNDSMCLKYADMFMVYSDSVDFGKRQEMAATVNNQYLYYKNEAEEKRLIEDNEKYRNRIVYLIVGFVLISLSFLLIHLYKKNKHLAELMELTNRMGIIKSEKERVSKDLSLTRDSLKTTKDALEDAHERLACIKQKIKGVEEELRHKEQVLSEKVEENKRFVSMLHKANMEENAADVVKAIKDASVGKHRMTAEEWQKFYHAVDMLQPELMEKIMHNLGKFTEQQQQVCYLMSIGLTNSQIENLTDIPHVTVWRWVKKFNWV